MRRSPVPALAAGLLACLAVLAVRADDPPKPGTTGNPDNVKYLDKKSDPKGNPIRLAKATGHVSNYSEDKVAPYTLPDPLVLASGEKVTTPEAWAKKRRPEILKFYQTEIYGRIPENVPKVTWEVTDTDAKARDGTAVMRKVVGRMGEKPDGPKMNLTVYTPAKVDKPVPVLLNISFGFGAGKGPQKAGAFDPVAEVLGRGWAYATIGYGDIQPDRPDQWTQGVIGLTLKADQKRPAPDEWGTISAWAWGVSRCNGAGLTRGIIGLTNKGQPRKPEDWGSLRAWAWGASRALDYLETDKDVDAKQVGISGLSRYGKAALVAMAYEPRFAIGLIGSSGAGGAKLFRRNFGEQVENLTGSGEYHWMSGTFLKYGGPLAPCDLPVDAHQLIAMCAPRPTFISYGASSGPGAEGTWVDQRGSFMAAVAAGPAWKLLGKKDLGATEMPEVGKALVDGELAWRMHSGGHTTGPNIETFVNWASRYIKAPAAKEPAKEAPAKEPAAKPRSVAATPTARTDANSRTAHEQLLEKAKKGRIDVYFTGDSITRRWGATDYPDFLANWKENFHGWNAANFGWGGDTVQNVLWRLTNGELDGVKPKVIVVMAGTNNVGGGREGYGESRADDIAEGLKAVLDVCREKAPDAVVILMGITPRNDNPAALAIIDKVNEQFSKLADGKKVRYLNINDKLADKDGKLLEGMSPDRLHLSAKGYQVWADALKPVLTELLGPPAKEDLAPPPTGDPSKK